MEIKRIINALRRRWWVILLVLALGTGLGFLSTVLIKPMYKAETNLYIANRNKVLLVDESLQDIEASQQLVLKYTDVISSRSLTSRVLEQVNNVLTEKQLLSMVSIISKKDSNILTIETVWHDPLVAANIANAMGTEFINQIKIITNSDNVGVLDAALVPPRPVTNNTIRILLGTLIGLIAAFGAVYFLEYYDDRVHDPEDIEDILKVRVVGIVPKYDNW